ncbi:leucine-rich repeat domain-containing protein [uncultured Muribaculum sp.]|uniref:leucine-rich repeat domain-containing protein n=1 Tax=uncultured Muribaculum sp. TaxID=1918613 RepID=UPI0025DB337A|nr:leucine-rich repeat domain-containing protein [uncultured Muribaculum sp.]
MKKIKLLIVCMLIELLQFTAVGQFQAAAQTATGVYTVNVNTPGTFGQVILKTVDNWSDVVELTVSGYLNETDMAYFSRMQNMTKLDLSQVDITCVSGCEGLGALQSVVLPESVTKVADNAFKNCSSLSAINLSHIAEIGSSSFYKCVNLTGDLTLNNLMTLGAQAFSNCSGITTVEMPVVTEVGDYAFSMNNSNSSLTAVNLPNVTSIGAGAFQYCSKLQSIYIPNCTYLGNDDITNAYRGDCFRYCSNLTSVTLSDELEFIPYETFCSTGLKTIKLPSALKAIGNSAFEVSKLSSIDIPEGVKTIGEEAFSGCPLENIALPSTLESIANDAFYYRKENYNSSTGNYSYTYVLKDVYCKSVAPIVTSVFNNDMAKGATLHVPAFSISAYKLDDNWYMFNKIEALEGDLTDITINNTFTIIDYTGLANNANLTLTSSQTAGHLTISGDGTLSLDNFTQNQNFESKRDDYYDENNHYTYRYSYPYCTTLITNNEVRANNVTTKILLPTNRWSFISLPYDVNVSSIVVPEGTMWVVRKYNGSNRASMSGETWENATSGQTLNAGEGYIFHCINGNGNSWDTDYVEFEFPAINNSNKNNIFSCNDVLRTIKEYPAEFSHNRGWNLIGNPYPSYLNSRYVDFAAPITVWNGNGYTAYSLADDEYVLRPNEAFFVQCPLNTNQVKFHKDGRTHNYTSSPIPDYLRSRAQASNSRSILNFIISNEKYSDRTRLVLNESASYDYEIEKDASKFMSSNENVPQIYIIDNGVHYAIDERPLGTGEYSLGVYIGTEGDYKIALNANNSEYDIFLVDKEANETTKLNEKTYSFKSASQTANNRFALKVMPRGGLSSIGGVSANNAGFTVNGNKLSVDNNTPISIYTIDGRLIYHGIVDDPIELSSGIYLLSISNTTHKIAIK